MASNDADRQINQMIDFIIAEANEKAEEIRQKANAEHESQYQEMLRELQKRLTEEFKHRREQRKIERLIQASKQKQAARMSVMELRDAKMKELRTTVVEKLVGIEKHKSYPDLIVNLIVQGLIIVQEERVVIRCRKEDEAIVSSVLTKAAEAFKKAVHDSTGYTPNLQPLKIDTTKYLAPAYDGKRAEYCSGGVSIIARNGRIICNNTLDARLDIAFYQLTPTMRSMLFGARPPSNKAPAPAAHHGHH